MVIDAKFMQEKALLSLQWKNVHALIVIPIVWKYFNKAVISMHRHTMKSLK